MNVTNIHDYVIFVRYITHCIRSTYTDLRLVKSLRAYDSFSVEIGMYLAYYYAVLLFIEFHILV